MDMWVGILMDFILVDCFWWVWCRSKKFGRKTVTGVCLEKELCVKSLF